ncbi:50S ribosomal protein L1 [Candidatus Saccharibacteria bacterium]|nr:50S ribosomal protein L1 [Candidatus Saccharibacteria bacterium]
MVDKKTGVKPKAPKAQKLETSKKKLVNSKVKTEKVKPEPEEAERLIPNSELLVTAEPKAAAKAGRRSAKAIKEAEEERARQERIRAGKVAPEAPKEAKKPPRSRLERAGKKYREMAKLVEKGRLYPLAEALDLATKTSTTKFDATVELHVNLGVDPTQADQNVRDNVTLPAGTGKTLRVAVFAEGDEVTKAKAAGADIAGEADLLAKLDKEEIDFDVLISSPNLMARLGKYAKLLGPKGLMPNPKSGTITTDIPKAIKEAKAGRVEYRVDQAGIVHLGIGKVSFGPEKLHQNADLILSSIRGAKPASLKGTYINSIYVSSTMGPSIKVAV